MQLLEMHILILYQNIYKSNFRELRDLTGVDCIE